MYFIYSKITILILIISPVLFLFRLLKGKEDKKRFLERFCFFSKQNSSNTIWFHAASVGELMSIVPVIKKFESNDRIKKILLTTTTTSSAKIFTKLNLRKTTHQYFPLDISFFSKKFIKFWKPQLAIFVDSEIWPNMFLNLHEKKIPIILLNARITKKSFNRWKLIKSFANIIFSKISLALTQNSETKKYLKFLGVKNIKSAGNLKYYGEKKIINLANFHVLKRFKKFKIWCAGSTHNSEEILIGKVHKQLKTQEKKLLTIIIPRHINRSKKIISELKEINLKVVTHSKTKIIPSNTDVYLVDTFGETSKFYNLSNISFIGGSFIKHGGQNPLEAVRLGNYVVSGKNINNFKEIYSYLGKNKISFIANDKKGIEKIIKKKLDKKLPNIFKNKIYNNGIKILDKNIFYINKFIR